ncbi:NAD(P)-dependent alcohol dehydrogenase [Arthrobacter jiangjiafuii]|nr:NAD(P)-dependent alcohol dehydrogenase [Arthrobacter jiangjiafuii]
MSAPIQPAGATAAGAAPRTAAPRQPQERQPQERQPQEQAAPDLMAAVVQRGYGTSEVLHLARIPRPEISAREVLVRVHAAGLAKGAWHIMTGKPYLLRAVFGLRSPRQNVLGNNLAGTVVAVGGDVTRFQVGDEVYGIGRGTFAEYSAAPEDKLAPKPKSLTFEQAAVAPVSGLTALQAVSDIGRVTAGQKALVLGAAGGVGSFAVQIAKAAGAEVTGACRGSKAGFVRSLGADHILDYTRDDFAAGPQRYDVIISIAGNPALRRLRRALTPRGTAVLVGGEEGGVLTGGMIETQIGGRILSLFTGQRLIGALCKERAADLERLTALIDAGQVMPLVDGSFALADVAAAMQRLESGTVQGSVMLTV